MCAVGITIFSRMVSARSAAVKLLIIIITMIHWDKAYSETQQIFRPFSLASGPTIEAAHLWIQS